MNSNTTVHVVGGGLAGCEAAIQLARRGLSVVLYEAKPVWFSEAHEDEHLAELVCSNSLKSDRPPAGSALLKRELNELGCALLQVAAKTRVPAGSALSVDRSAFSREVTRLIESNPGIEVIRTIVHEPPGLPCIVATGPLSAGGIVDWLLDRVGTARLHFYDAIAPIVDADSLNMDVLFKANRREQGEGDYLNSPMDEEQYEAFVTALLEAEQVIPRPFEEQAHFDACQPIERLAEKGRLSLAFGPLRPIGLVDPRTGKRPYAVVQLRPENRDGTAYNLVGCQTRMTRSAQERVFRMLPGLEHAVFLRYGSVHRNTYLDGPEVLGPELSLKVDPRVYLAGQITGAEGYVEAMATGWLAAHFLYSRLCCTTPLIPPETTALGGLLRYITAGTGKDFTPSNFHYGLLPPIRTRVKGRKARRQALFDRAVEDIIEFRRKGG